jgi:hypothetical protein
MEKREHFRADGMNHANYNENKQYKGQWPRMEIVM